MLTQRSSKLKSHSGEVCLPGGKREPGDPVSGAGGPTRRAPLPA